MIRKNYVIIFIILTTLSCNKAEKDYKIAKETNTIEAFQLFLEKHNEDKWVTTAKNDIAGIKYHIISDTSNITLFKDFVQNYQGTEWADSAQIQIDRIEYLKIKKSTNIDTITKFIQDYSNNAFISNAKELLSYLTTKNLNSDEAYTQFIEIYPKSEYLEEIKQLLYNISFEKAIIDTSYKYPENEFYKRALNENNSKTLNAYIIRYPKGANIENVKSKLKRAIKEEKEKNYKIDKAFVALEKLINELIAEKPLINNNIGIDAMISLTNRFYREQDIKDPNIKKALFLILDYMNPYQEKNYVVRAYAWEKFNRIWFLFHTRHISGISTQGEMEQMKYNVLDEFIKKETNTSILSLAKRIILKYGEILNLFNTQKGSPSMTKNSITIGNKTVKLDN